MQLSDFLKRSLGEPFVWGERDCALWAASWVAAKRGVDPAVAWRGRYHSALGCARLVRASGGLQAAIARDMERAGFETTAAPQPGDVGLVDTPAGVAAAIKTARGWAWKGKVGVTVHPLQHLIAWSV
jgi:hypothetical protein